MKSNPQLRVVNDVPSQSQDGGVSVKTVVFVAALTAIASQLAVDGYRFFKKKFHEKREELKNNPQGFALPMPTLPTSGGSLVPWREANPQGALSEDELRAWERELSEREARLQSNGR
jgi:hypothetical protein